jgi:hypothetical protein
VIQQAGTERAFFLYSPEMYEVEEKEEKNPVLSHPQ